MQEDTINVFCLSHGVSFTMPRSNQAVICKEDPTNHVLSDNFPNSGTWFYCCQCQIYWATSKEQGGFLRQCPSCGLVKNPRYYSCDQCNVTMMDSWGATNQRDVYITPWGAPHPYCPGCYQLPKSVSQSHTCPELNGLLTTAHTECPFCEVEERDGFEEGIATSEESFPQPDTESAASSIEEEIAAPEERSPQPDTKSAASSVTLQPDTKGAVSSVTLPAGAERQNGIVDKEGAGHEAEITQIESIEAEIAQIESIETKIAQIESIEAEIARVESIEADVPGLFLDELERKAAEIRALEAEAREANGLERLRQVEVELQHEIFLRSGLSVQVEEEKNARLAAEQAKAEVEARFREMEARAYGAEERGRQAETGLQQEVAKRTLAEERANKIEIEFNRSLELAQAEFETRITKLKAETQSSEESIIDRLAQQAREEVEARVQEVEAKAKQADENYKVEIAEIRAEARQAEENYRVEIAEIRAELEATVTAAKQAEENYRAEITKVSAEAEAKAHQAEENHRAEIAKVGAEAEARVHQAEANARQQYQTKVEEAIASAQSAMFTLEETQKKLIEAEAKYREMEARASRAETRSRQIYLISRLSFAFIEQIFGEPPKMSDEEGGLVIPPDFATNAYPDKFFSEAPESDTNDSMDYFSLPDKLKAMFEALASAHGFDDEGNGMTLGPVNRAPSQDAIPASVILAPAKSVIS